MTPRERLVILVLVLVVLAGVFVAGYHLGHVRTNCGEVYYADGSHQHQCWIVHHTEG